MTELKRDERWSVFVYTKDADFEKYIRDCIPEVWLKPEVPKHVHDSFGIIRKLLEHSYYVYEFYDEAANKALLTFEMALKLKFEEIENKKWKGTLQKLIQYFVDGQYFEADSQAFFDHIRHVRNRNAHPEQHSFGGGMMRQWIEIPMGLINDLYEDRQLRAQRFAKREQIMQYYDAIIPTGAEVITNNKRYILGGARLLFIDNKIHPEVYYFGFVPVFTLEERKNMNFEDRSLRYPIQTVALKCEIDNALNTMTLVDQNGQDIIIRPVSDSHGKDELSAWNKEFETFGEVPVRFTSYMSDLEPWFKYLWRDFHMR